ncbi:ion-transporting P-type ATPase SPF1 [Paracoccidioides brasiliensis Pb18]|uniref:Deacetylase sirtuin-type domain-containing protein n=1 Tax=Paracoccidioides brasiliensis (strain Pb18) TaxID=502780 RepID=C1GFX8_PARBD|nr:ion-transporting P-type ATPase SPF1 [Paracoccidioides brasiliensis Pb18]EEH50085.2 hypothetical protein PADG_06164 [Paracoccidioides brasiliensis Pb18]
MSISTSPSAQTQRQAINRSLAIQIEGAYVARQRALLRSRVAPSEQFVIDSASYDSFNAHLKSSERVLVVLGAGLSAASGIGTYVDEGGYWRTHNVRRLGTYGAFREDPSLIWWFYSDRRREMMQAEPNKGHYAIAELAKKMGNRMLTVCQNIDGDPGLCPRAGQPEATTVYLHGDYFTFKCSSEKCTYTRRDENDPIVPALTLPSTHLISDPNYPLPLVPEESLPRCPACSSLLRPSVTWFGEAMPSTKVNRIDDWLHRVDSEDQIDLVLLIGTAATVHPVLSLVVETRKKGAKVCVVNPDKTSAEKVGGLDEGNWWFRGGAEEVLTEIFKGVIGALSGNIMPRLVDNSQIRSASLHNPLPLQLHAYVWPFLIIWPVFFAVYLSPERYDTYIQGSEWTFVWAGTILTLQALVWLSTKWNVSIDALFTTSKAKSAHSAKLIKVMPVVNAGTAEICPLFREKYGGKDNISFLFQKRRFLYSPERKCFAPLSYAIDAEPKPLLKTFQQSRGLQTDREVEEIQNHYGENTFDIPVPTFTELFKEHAVAPFFVFQVFCVGLWLLDEYWYYSLFTLFMLVAFESTVVWQRQRTLNEFRGMSIKPYDVWVYRKNAWTEITSDKLLPGDVLSVNRTKEDSGVACDVLMIEGSVIVNEAMLSGESTPLLKDSIQLRPGDDQIDPEGLDKNSFLYGGTKVLQITHPNSGDSLPNGISPPPDDGAVGVVVKTGFETSQGSLVRTMIYSTERVSANNVEALLFILFLLIFAIAASWYVWLEGVAKDRKRSKLLLDCVLIITSVVPPELPMELSLAVNTSLAALSRFAIFCTEPFRIPYAGRIDIACFDKTGTLTGEDLLVDGIAGLSLGHAGAKVDKHGAHTDIIPVEKVANETTLVLATAHALVKLDEGDIVGDPMEKATLTALGWVLGHDDILTSKASGSSRQPGRALDSVQIKRRFQFSSALKRQSAIATVVSTDRQTSKKLKGTFVGVKGAPETIRTMLVSTPPHYEETFKYFTRNGARVLALGYKYLSTESELGQGRINNLKREDVESDLHFAGFLVLQCPLKDDAINALRMLNESSHRVVMITGDNPLTAAHVARQVEIVDREVLILDAPENDSSGTKLVWRTIDDGFSVDVDPSKPLDSTILKTKDLCVTGYALSKFKNQKALTDLLRHTWVYARVSPKQKEDILLGMKDAGYTTLMCGDGTNDVGALKQAHVGVALLNGSQDDLNKIAEHFRNTKMKEVYEKQVGLMSRFNQPAPPVPVAIAHLYPPGPNNPHYEKAMLREAQRKGITAATAGQPGQENGIATITTPGAQAIQVSTANLTPQQLQKHQASIAAAGLADKLTASMMEQELDDSEPPTIKLGDASVAAPFTSKLANVIAIPNIIRQGRCTLVATIQMYKILALNCLISAYSLSVIYLDGIRFGDGQATISGILMSVCFLSISRAKSVEGLSKERPQPNIFNMYIMGSVLGQFAIHVATLIYLSNYVYSIEPKKEVIDLEGEFEPSLLNSAIYLLQLIQQISTFSINYQGRPFRESIRENRGMYWGLILTSGVAFSCATEFIPELNEKLRLVPFTTEFKFTLTGLMLIDYVGCWLVENVLKRNFSDYRPKDIAVRRPDQLAREEERKRLEEEEEEEEREREKASKS